ncbi:MAG: DUF3368 domain-containing protein [Chloroflexi bacterium]|nr:DUF3368 domain-containing protein [Chloroflexota bacterium]
MTVVISNTTPFVGLSITGNFESLKTLFGEIKIPEAVYQEMIVAGATRPGAAEMLHGITNGWIRVEAVHPSNTLITLKVDLDDGEAEAIALALQTKADLVLLDERKARAKAKALGLDITGTVGIILLAHRKGLDVDVASALARLKEQGFRISDQLYQRVLRDANTDQADE